MVPIWYLYMVSDTVTWDMFFGIIGKQFLNYESLINYYNNFQNKFLHYLIKQKKSLKCLNFIFLF